MTMKKANYDVPGLRAGLEVLTQLCDSPEPLGAAELAERTGTNKHMVFRCLKTLVAKGWVTEFEGGPKYSLTLVPFHYVAKPLARMDIVSASEEPLRELWKATGECVYLGVMHQGRMMFLIHRDGTRDVHLGGRIGEHYWPHASAPGKVMLAFGDPAALDRYVKHGLRALTPRTHTDTTLFLQEMEQIRHQGFATDDQEYTTGGLCYAVPVYDYTGHVVAAIGTTVLAIHYTLAELVKKIAPEIQKTAKRISTVLGSMETIHKPKKEEKEK